MTRKRITLRLPTGLYAAALIKTINRGETLNDYLTRLVAADLETP